VGLEVVALRVRVAHLQVEQVLQVKDFQVVLLRKLVVIQPPVAVVLRSKVEILLVVDLLAPVDMVVTG
jgi:hypothetical protein